MSNVTSSAQTSRSGSNKGESGVVRKGTSNGENHPANRHIVLPLPNEKQCGLLYLRLRSFVTPETSPRLSGALWGIEYVTGFEPRPSTTVSEHGPRVKPHCRSTFIHPQVKPSVRVSRQPLRSAMNKLWQSGPDEPLLHRLARGRCYLRGTCLLVISPTSCTCRGRQSCHALSPLLGVDDDSTVIQS